MHAVQTACLLAKQRAVGPRGTVSMLVATYIQSFHQASGDASGEVCIQSPATFPVLPSAGDIDFATTTRNVTFTVGNPFVMADIVIFEDFILEVDEDFEAHLVVNDDTLDGRVTAGNITDVVVTILDDEGL